MPTNRGVSPDGKTIVTVTWDPGSPHVYATVVRMGVRLPVSINVRDGSPTSCGGGFYESWVDIATQDGSDTWSDNFHFYCRPHRVCAWVVGNNNSQAQAIAL